MRFQDGIKIPYAPFVQERDGMLYMPWMSAVSLAQHENIPEASDLVIPIGNGCAVRMSCESGDSILVPVLTQDGAEIRPGDVTCVDLNHAIVRGRAKLLAITSGVGLPLWLKMTDTKAFLKRLGVTPESNLREVEPWVQTLEESGLPYVPWAAAVAAASIVDEGFAIEQEPAVECGMVLIKMSWKGRHYHDYYPMAQEINGQLVPMKEYGAQDFSRAQMRGLTRLIAQVTGYGASVYAKEDQVSLLNSTPLQRGAKAPTQPVSDAGSTPASSGSTAASAPANGGNVVPLTPSKEQRASRAATKASDNAAPATPSAATPLSETPPPADEGQGSQFKAAEAAQAATMTRVPRTSDAARAKSDAVELELRRARVFDAMALAAGKSTEELEQSIRARLDEMARAPAEAVRALKKLGLCRDEVDSMGDMNRFEFVAMHVMVSKPVASETSKEVEAVRTRLREEAHRSDQDIIDEIGKRLQTLKKSESEGIQRIARYGLCRANLASVHDMDRFELIALLSLVSPKRSPGAAAREATAPTKNVA